MQDQQQSNQKTEQTQIKLSVTIFTQEELQQKEKNDQNLRNQLEQLIIKPIMTQSSIKTFEDLPQENYDNAWQKLIQIQEDISDNDEKKKQKNQLTQFPVLEKQTISLTTTSAFDQSPQKKFKNNKKSEKKKQKSHKVYPVLNELNDQKLIQRIKVLKNNQVNYNNQQDLTQNNYFFNLQQNKDQIIDTCALQEFTSQIQNILEIEKQDKINDLESQQSAPENQKQSKLTRCNKRRKKWICFSLFLVLAFIALCLGLGLYFGLKSDQEGSLQKNLVDLQYKVNKTLSFNVQCQTTQITIQKDGKQSITESVIDHKVKIFCQNVTEEGNLLLLELSSIFFVKQIGFQLYAYLDETRAYQVGKENQTTIKSGIRDFLNRTLSHGRILNPSQNLQTGRIQNYNFDKIYFLTFLKQGTFDPTNHTFNTSNIDITDHDDYDNFTVPEKFPYPKEIVLLSTAEIVAFNISKSGEILEITFPINLDPSFLHFIPKLLSTLSPSVLKENYNIIEEDAGVKRILQEGKQVTGRNVEGEFVMSKMDKHETEQGEVKLVQAYTQSTQNNYTQITNSVEETTFNEKGYLTQAEVQTTQKLGDPNNQEDLIHSMDLKQSLRVNFLHEEDITQDEHENLFNVFGLMGKFGAQWDIFFQLLNKMRESNIQNTSLKKDEQNEPPLVSKNQYVETKQPTTRFLSQNDNMVEDLNIELFSKSVLSIPMKSFISFLCQKNNLSNENDKCKTQLFLSFLGINIPVTPVKEDAYNHIFILITVSFPMTKFKNGINWFRKNVLLFVHDIKSNVIEVIDELEQIMNTTTKTLEKFFSKLESPYIGIFNSQKINKIFFFDYIKIRSIIRIYPGNNSKDIFCCVKYRISASFKYIYSFFKEYGFLKDTIQTLISEYEDNIMAGIQESVLKVKVFLPIFQYEVQNQINMIEDIIKNKKNMINSEVLNEIKNLIQSIKTARYVLFEEQLNNLMKEVLDMIQNQFSTIIDQIMNYFNLQQEFFQQQDGLVNQEMKDKINQMIKTSLTTLLSKPFLMLHQKMQDIITNTDKKLQQSINLTKQSIDKILEEIEQKLDKLDTINNSAEELIIEIQEQIQYVEDFLEQYTDEFTIEHLVQKVQENIELLSYTIKQEIPGSVQKINKLFSDLIQSLTSDFNDILINIKAKAKDIQQDIVSTIESQTSSIMSQFDDLQKMLVKKVENLFKLLKVDIISQNIQNSIKSQLKELKDKLVDDTNDIQINSSKNRNLSTVNLFDMSILSFVSEIKDFSSQGIQRIKETVKRVNNLYNIFNEFSGQLQDVFVQPFVFSDFLQLDLKFDDEQEQLINTQELLSLFKYMIDDLKKQFIQFAKAEIIEIIQKSGLDLIKNKKKQILLILSQYKQLGETLVKQLFDSTLSNLLDSNKWFEIIISKISSLFKQQYEIKLMDTKIQLPEIMQPYFIPTPLGVPIQLSYAFLFDAYMSIFLGIEGFSVIAGFKVASNAIFEATAALSIVIAEAGVMVQGQLLRAELLAQFSLSVYPNFSGIFQVNAKFRALSLYAAIYFAYIKIDIELKCTKIFRRHRRRRILGWFSSFIDAIVDILSFPIKIIKSAIEIFKNLVTNGEICFPIPIITRSEKIPILPPLVFNGLEFEKTLVKIQFN